MNPKSKPAEAAVGQRNPAEASGYTRPFYWSIRRELWEHPSIYVAPLLAAAVVLVGFSLGSILGIWEPALRLKAEQPRAPYEMASGLMMLTAIVVSFLYSLDALHGERADRSILFWKSLPVSDATTVLAKACIPLVVVPLLVVAITIAIFAYMLLLGSAVMLASGQSTADYWGNVSIFKSSWLMMYHIVTAHALWPAPIYCWLLLVSGWARRATFLWAILPLVVVAGIEQTAFRTWHFAALIAGRLMGEAPTVEHTSHKMFPTNPMVHATPLQFLASPGLWIGLLLAAVFLMAAVRMRRYRAPV